VPAMPHRPWDCGPSSPMPLRALSGCPAGGGASMPVLRLGGNTQGQVSQEGHLPALWRKARNRSGGSPVSLQTLRRNPGRRMPALRVGPRAAASATPRRRMPCLPGEGRIRGHATPLFVRGVHGASMGRLLVLHAGIGGDAHPASHNSSLFSHHLLLRF
jgi:hypothetical protein